MRVFVVLICAFWQIFWPPLAWFTAMWYILSSFMTSHWYDTIAMLIFFVHGCVTRQVIPSIDNATFNVSKIYLKLSKAATLFYSINHEKPSNKTNILKLYDKKINYWGLGGRLLAEQTLEPHSRSSLLVSSLWTNTSMKHKWSSFSVVAVAIASVSSSSHVTCSFPFVNP